jgi:DNA integrity scanning protein DisA with diadenylate cyclase activity
LPLTKNPNISRELGTRHRAAIGITEGSDAISIVVSEETGVISFIKDGNILRNLDTKTLRKLMLEAMDISIGTDRETQTEFQEEPEAKSLKEAEAEVTVG